MATPPYLSFIDPSNMCICSFKDEKGRACGKGVLKKECYIYFPERYECKVHFENTKQNYQDYQQKKYYYEVEAPPPPSGLYEKAISSYKSIKNWLFPEPLVK